MDEEKKKVGSEKPIRIHIINFFNPQIGWGSEKGALEVAKILSEHLKNEGADVEIIFHGTNLGEDHLTPEEMGVKVVKHNPWSLNNVVNHISEGDYVIFSQSSLTPGLVSKVLEKVRPEQIILLDQAPFPYRPHQPEGTLRDKISRFLARKIFKRVPNAVKERSLFLVFNDKQKKVLERAGFKNVVRAELPMDVNEIPPPVPKTDKFRIVYMGRIDFDKGPILLYKSLARFLEKLNDEERKKVEVHIIGDGMLFPLLKFLMNRLKKKYGVDIKLHGYMKKERFNILSQSHVKLILSRMESAFNYSGREAGTAGLTIIHGELPIVKEEKREGLHVVKRDPEAVAEKIHEEFLKWNKDPEAYEEERKKRSQTWRISTLAENERLKYIIYRYILGLPLRS